MALAVGKQAAGLSQPSPVQRIAHAAGIGKLGLLQAQLQIALERLGSTFAKTVILLRQHLSCDLLQLGRRVVREIKVVGNARAHAGVRLKEGVHPVFVAGQDHHQVVALVLHYLQQDLDRLLPVVALVLGPVQVVGLVNEQHPAHGALEYLFGLGCRVADVLAHQVITRDRDQMPFAHEAQPVQDLRHAQRDRGLAGAGVAAEAHVQAGRLARQPQVEAQLVNHQQGGNVADAGLDRLEADQVGIELLQHRLHLRAGQHLRDRAGAGSWVSARHGWQAGVSTRSGRRWRAAGYGVQRGAHTRNPVQPMG